MKKLNAVAAATDILMSAAEMETIQREAALKMPIKDAMRQLHAKLQADLDAALKVAIERRLGVELTDPEVQLEGHAFQNVGYPGEPGDFYHLDGVAILWAGPIELTRMGDDMRATQTLKHL